jgi:type IV secretory pathway protease TraF
LSDGVVGLLLSVIPGLPHFLKGRFREVSLYVALWFLCMALGLFLYGSAAGSLLIGLAIGLHAWIALQYGVFREVLDLAGRAGIVLAVVAVLTVLYWAVPRVAARGLATGHTSITIPAMNVEHGDFLLVLRIEDDAASGLPRGALVLFNPPAFRNAGRDLVANPNDAMIGQVVGLPGETIQIADTTYVADGQVLDPARYPVPGWLQRRPPKSGITIPRGTYFVSTEYGVHVHGQARLTDGMIGNACLVSASDIRGRAFMRWWPLARRGFIE